MTEEETTRVPLITSREQVPEDQRHNYDLIEETRGSVRGPFPPLLNSPEIAGRVGHLGTYIRYEGVLPGDVRELAIITTAREFDAAFEWAAHEPIAREEGVRDEAIEVVANRGSLDDLTEPEALIVRFGRELFREHEVSDATFDAAKDHFGVQGVTELTATMGFYSMIAAVLNTFEVLPGDDAPTLP